MLVVYSLVKSMQPDGLEILDDPVSYPNASLNYPLWKTISTLFLHWYSQNESFWRKFYEEFYFLTNLLHSSVSINIFLSKINTLLQINWFPYLKSQLLFSSTHLSRPPSTPIFLSLEDLANFFWEKGNKMCVLTFFFFSSHPLMYLQCRGWGIFSFFSPLTPQSDLGSLIPSPYLPLWHDLFDLSFLSYITNMLYVFLVLEKNPHPCSFFSFYFSVFLVFSRANLG